MASTTSGRSSRAPRSLSLITTSLRSTRASSRATTEETEKTQEASQKRTRKSKELDDKIEIEGEDGKIIVIEEIQETPGDRKMRICCFVFSLLLNLIPMGMVFVGSYFYKQCPIQPEIPLWLIVGGSLYLVNSTIDIYEYFSKNSKGSRIATTFQMLIMLLMFIWLITGSVWIYSVHSDVEENSKSDYYCHKLVFMTAFYTCSIGNVFVALTFLICFVYGLLKITQ